MLDHYPKISQASLEPFQGALKYIFRTLGFFVAGSVVVPSKQFFPVLESSWCRGGAACAKVVKTNSYDCEAMRQNTFKILVPWWTSKELVAMNVHPRDIPGKHGGFWSLSIPISNLQERHGKTLPLQGPRSVWKRCRCFQRFRFHPGGFPCQLPWCRSLAGQEPRWASPA